MRRPLRSVLPLAPFAMVTALVAATDTEAVPDGAASASGHRHPDAVAVRKVYENPECAPGEGRETLARDQRTLLRKLGGLVVLRNENDVSRLAGQGYDSYAHWQTSLAGVGWTVGDLDAIIHPEFGRPGLLMYRPKWNGNNKPSDGYDFPYVLVGWAYLAPYDIAKHPASLLPCVPRAEWFLHERGIHTASDGGFKPVPPDEDKPGTEPGADPPSAPPPSYGHARSWATHIFLNGSSVPTIATERKGIPGLPVPAGSFWYPPRP